MLKIINQICIRGIKYIIIMVIMSIFHAVCLDKKKILNLGEINIKGELRRPNINLVYSKKYFNKTMSTMANSELIQFEKELLKPKKIVKK